MHTRTKEAGCIVEAVLGVRRRKIFPDFRVERKEGLDSYCVSRLCLRSLYLADG